MPSNIFPCFPTPLPLIPGLSSSDLLFILGHIPPVCLSISLLLHPQLFLAQLTQTHLAYLLLCYVFKTRSLFFYDQLMTHLVSSHRAHTDGFAVTTYLPFTMESALMASQVEPKGTILVLLTYLAGALEYQFPSGRVCTPGGTCLC